ncbi:hypothetical protein AN958_05308 [Leucoagaricus sp. SymC.cos]|nr:hypothetical protein AN958_05308 [Leucoagaricus sp. SymC.cos]
MWFRTFLGLSPFLSLVLAQTSSSHCRCENGSISGCYLNTSLGFAYERGSVPPVGVDPRTAEDVQAVVKFVDRYNLRFVIKNTEHDYLGRSAGRDAFMVWTHNLKNITYDPDFIPEGGSAEEAAASVDSVIQFSIALPNGEHTIVNTQTNADPFWALRGGGAGSWGVITSAAYKTYDLVPLTISGHPQIAQTVVTEFIRRHPQLSDLGWGGYSWINNQSLFALFVALNENVIVSPFFEFVRNAIGDPTGVRTFVEPFENFHT